MPGFAVKQPNGLYARFSTVVDDFTHLNYDRESLHAVILDQYGRRAADDSMDWADKHPDLWTDCLATVSEVHDDDVVAVLVHLDEHPTAELEDW